MLVTEHTPACNCVPHPGFPFISMRAYHNPEQSAQCDCCDTNASCFNRLQIRAYHHNMMSYSLARQNGLTLRWRRNQPMRRYRAACIEAQGLALPVVAVDALAGGRRVRTLSILRHTPHQCQEVYLGLGLHTVTCLAFS